MIFQERQYYNKGELKFFPWHFRHFPWHFKVFPGVTQFSRYFLTVATLELTVILYRKLFCIRFYRFMPAWWPSDETLVPIRRGWWVDRPEKAPGKKTSADITRRHFYLLQFIFSSRNKEQHEWRSLIKNSADASAGVGVASARETQMSPESRIMSEEPVLYPPHFTLTPYAELSSTE